MEIVDQNEIPDMRLSVGSQPKKRAISQLRTGPTSTASVMYFVAVFFL